MSVYYPSSEFSIARFIRQPTVTAGVGPNNNAFAYVNSPGAVTVVNTPNMLGVYRAPQQQSLVIIPGFNSAPGYNDSCFTGRSCLPYSKLDSAYGQSYVPRCGSAFASLCYGL